MKIKMWTSLATTTVPATASGHNLGYEGNRVPLQQNSGINGSQKKKEEESLIPSPLSTHSEDKLLLLKQEILVQNLSMNTLTPSEFCI